MNFSSLMFTEIHLPVLFGGVFIGYFLGLLVFRKSSNNCASELENSNNANKMDIKKPTVTVALVVNSSLKMGKGKIAAQCGHAILSLCKKAKKKSNKLLETWNLEGQDIKLVSVKSDEDFDCLEQVASMEKLDSYIVADAGRTQIKSGSLTVMGIGPGEIDTINNVIGHLRSYS